MSEERFKDAFRRIVSQTPEAPAFSDLETHRASPASPPLLLKPWMAVAGAAALVLVVVGAVGLLGGGGPDVAGPGLIDYVKIEYSATVDAVCEGGQIIDNGGFDEATIEIWGPNSDDLTLMVSTFPDGSTERIIVEGEPVDPDVVWVEASLRDDPTTTKFRAVDCDMGSGGGDLILGGNDVAVIARSFLGPPPGFDTWGAALAPGLEAKPTEWEGNAVLLYELRNEIDSGSNAVDIYITEDDRRALSLHAERSHEGIGMTVFDYSVVESDWVAANSVSFSTAGLTAIVQEIIGPGNDSCKVTIPRQGFTPPEAYPSTPSDPAGVWYGSDNLWTVLPIEGKYLPTKSAWWSANFPGGGAEEVPDIRVEYRLLDFTRDLVIPVADGTNASTEVEGDFMIAGFDPNVTGCWEVTAFYKDASLTYVYYNPRGDDPSEIGYVPEVVGLTIAEAEELLSIRFYHSVFDSGNLEYIVCAQEPIQGTELAPGEIVHMRTASPDQLCDEIFGDLSPPVATCTNAEPAPGEFVVYFDCGSGEYPNPTAVVRELPPATSEATSFAIGTAFEQLVAGPSEQEISSGFGSVFSEASADALILAKFEAGHLTLDFTDAIFVNNASTTTGSLFFLAELNSNVFAFDEVESVDFLVNGSCGSIWVFVQAGPECHTVTRAEWEADQASWENG